MFPVNCYLDFFYDTNKGHVLGKISIQPPTQHHQPHHLNRNVPHPIPNTIQVNILKYFLLVFGLDIFTVSTVSYNTSTVYLSLQKQKNNINIVQPPMFFNELQKHQTISVL